MVWHLVHSLAWNESGVQSANSVWPEVGFECGTPMGGFVELGS